MSGAILTLNFCISFIRIMLDICLILFGETGNLWILLLHTFYFSQLLPVS
jgi:hypothetical protein